jgi:hypothetical protein
VGHLRNVPEPAPTQRGGGRSTGLCRGLSSASSRALITVSAVSPWRTALQRHRSLPYCVIGPVLLRALRRLGSICLSDAIADHPRKLASFRNSDDLRMTRLDLASPWRRMQTTATAPFLGDAAGWGNVSSPASIKNIEGNITYLVPFFAPTRVCLSDLTPQAYVISVEVIGRDVDQDLL